MGLPFIARSRRSSLNGMIYVAPAVVLLVLVLYGPAAIGVYQSFFGLAGAPPKTLVGLGQYAAIVGEPDFGLLVWRTFVFVAGSVVCTVALGLAIAMLINRQQESVARFLQIGVILPWAISSVVGALLFRWFYMSDLGVFREVMRRVGFAIGDPASSQVGAMTALIASATWKKLGFAVILLLSALKAIPEDYFEAARVDGASAFQRFREIVLPLLTGPILISSVVLGIADLNTVELPLIVTGGGPIDSTTTIALSIYQRAFSQYDFQKALTLAVIAFITNIVLVSLYVRSVRGKGA